MTGRSFSRRGSLAGAEGAVAAGPLAACGDDTAESPGSSGGSPAHRPAEGEALVAASDRALA